MKQTSIAVSFDEERLAALRLYMSQKDVVVEVAMEQALEQLYLKYVPSNVRDFIAMRATQANTPRRKNKATPADEGSEERHEQ